MSVDAFNDLMSRVAAFIGDDPLDDALADKLNGAFPEGGEDFHMLAGLCEAGEAEGWLCAREHGGIKFGRPIKPATHAGKFSVDVVRMKDVKGPHHIHTTGEIGAIIPIDGDPKFDGFNAGWYVYAPGSDHHPTVTDGDAYVIYLLPEGAIEFTGR